MMQPPLCLKIWRVVLDNGTTGPSPNYEKQPQTIIPPLPNFTGQVAWHLSNLDLSVGLPDGEA